MVLGSPSRHSFKGLAALCATPLVAIFLSSNVANLGNLAFNLIFSRWMGPDLFGQLATLLTLFLAVMGVLGAVQLAVSQKIAAAGADTTNLAAGMALLSRLWTIATLLGLPFLIAAAVLFDVHQMLGLGSETVLPILLLFLPLALPLSVSRGIAIGKLDAPRIVYSGQIEMWVRLVLALVAWTCGLGLQGVTAAIVLSVAAGWLPLCKTAYPRPKAFRLAAPIKGVLLAALPFALLQASQVILLDGDVIIAQSHLRSTDAGYVAALGLFQRIQFFGCFSLAAVLLPAVAREASSGRSPLRAAAPVFALFFALSAAVILGATLAPNAMINLVVGSAFMPMAEHLPYVSLAAAAFTLSYLLATYLVALGDRHGIFAMVAACPLQIVAISLSADTLSTFIAAKLACQLALVVWLVARAIQRSLPGQITVTSPHPAI